MQVEDLLRATDPGSNWKVDTILKDACQSVVDKACTNHDTNPTSTLACLMERFVQKNTWNTER